MKAFTYNSALLKISPRLDSIITKQSKLQIGQTLLNLNKIADRIEVSKAIKSNKILISRRLLGQNYSVSSPQAFHPLNYQLLPNHIIRTGPVVGVLIAGKEKSGEPPIAHRARIYRGLSQFAAQKNIFVYFFYADDVDWEQQSVKGLLYESRANQKSSLIKANFRLPDLVYNRISYRYKEDALVVQEFLHKASQQGIHVFNSRFLNKWEVHQSLATDSLTRDFVIDTERYSKETLKKFLEKYPEFFIKPIASSVGKGIIKVIATQPKRIQYYRLGKSSHWQICHSHHELYERLSISQGENYILQKGIKLASLKQRVFDIRAQVQKDGQGVWQFTGAAIRVAAVGKFVTHVPNGGSKRDYHQTIKEVFGTSGPVKEKLDLQLKTITQRVPLALEGSLGINLAVLSIDIGIDQDGQMWIIEVNSKPASFDENAIRKRHLDLLTDYFLFKSDFGATN